jgi:hypothetical protein
MLRLVRDLKEGKMKRGKNFTLVMVTLVTLLLTSTLIFAQLAPPARINYQGVLRDASGNPLNGLVTMTFNFYDSATAGTLLWEEIYDSGSYQPQLTVTGGLFTVVLGDTVHRNGGNEPLFTGVFANHTDVYLGVKVSTDAEMTPRIKVVSAPYSVNTAKLEGRAASTFANTSHTHAGTDISSIVANATHAVTADSATTASNCTNADTLDSQHAAYFLDTSSNTQTKSGELIILNALGVGIESTGGSIGGIFSASSYSGKATVAANHTGVMAEGTTGGGYFTDSDNTGLTWVGKGDLGIDARGNGAGGYFSDSDNSGYAYVGYGDYGIEGRGNTGGGIFYDLNATGYAVIGSGDSGLSAWGSYAGGTFDDSNSSSYAYVSNDTYKIFGSGTVSFVQNHPIEKDKVIVYACPEGDEVATYTRGTAKLVNGEAHVKLGETFQWVTNPDIGLTAHVTPKSKDSVLYVESVSTSELVVKNVKGFPLDATFDYLVYGLRIGFEESSIVQEKQQESYIPSFKNHRERYAKYPQLRTFNSLERFKKMESSVLGVDENTIDLSKANVLKASIHEYDPATDPPVDKLFGYMPEGNLKEAVLPANTSIVQVHAPSTTSRTEQATKSSTDTASIQAVEFIPNLPCFPVSESVGVGDVLVMDASVKGFVLPCRTASDPMIVGIAAGSANECKTISREESNYLKIPIATYGIVLCKVDSSYGSIHEGDLLVSSPTPGHAMRSENPKQGTIIGKALESLESGTGTIKVLVMLR